MKVKKKGKIQVSRSQGAFASTVLFKRHLSVVCPTADMDLSSVAKEWVSSAQNVTEHYKDKAIGPTCSVNEANPLMCKDDALGAYIPYSKMIDGMRSLDCEIYTGQVRYCRIEYKIIHTS